MKLGLVTYQMAAHWDCDKLLRMCAEGGFQGVELRTTHAHGVEPALSRQERATIRQKFADSPLELYGLGTTVEYHVADQSVLRRQIELSKTFALLARDVGARGIKVRPNGLQLDKGIPEEKTLEQIGQGFRETARFCQDLGLEAWMEVHGSHTSHPPRLRAILDAADHPACRVCWNSNNSDKDETGTIDAHFHLLKDAISLCHINELWREDYPWRRLFTLLKEMDYQGYTSAEIPGAGSDEDALRLLRYYRACWHAMTR